MNAAGTALEYVANYWETPLNVCEGIVVKADYIFEPVTFTRTAPAAPSSIPATMPDIPLQLPSTHGFGEDNAAVTIICDNADNADVISANQGSGRVVILQGRTLYKDGAWNTLCLPFDVSTTSGPLAGDGVVAMTLNTTTSGLSGSTLRLNFTEVSPSGEQGGLIPAGTPFILKWGEGDNLESPVFTGVTINANASTEVSFTGGKFVGTYASTTFENENKSILFLGASNKLYYPVSGARIGAQRAYFHLNEELRMKSEESSIKEIVLSFGEEDEETSLTGPTPDPSLVERGDWYDLSGRKIANGQWPTAKGIYIKNGKKILK